MFRNTGTAPAVGASLVIGLILWASAPVRAQDLDCARCHDDVIVESSAHPDVACADCHTNVTRAHRREGVEPLSDEESCGLCHGSVLRSIGRSVHGDKAACLDCHGSPHNIHEVSDLASAVSPVNQIKQCGTCHDDPPELVNGYLTSEHGRALLLSGLINAPSCSDCHGDHRIMEVRSERAPTEHHNSPEMCGTCHVMLFETWKNQSAHGLAWQEDREEGPVCVDCHKSHMIADPTTDVSRHAAADNCGGCHDEYFKSYDQSFHGKATHLGMSGGAVCADCHTPHSNVSAENPKSSVHPDNLLATCGKCHEDVTPSFATFAPHNDPTDPDDILAVYVVWVFMTGLLIGVFAFFGIHDLLWLQRSLVGVLRGEYKEEPSGGQWIRRFRLADRWTHITIIVTFLLLALTGLPLKFHDTAWAEALVNMLGGVDSTRFLHRLAAIGTFGYFAFHLGDLFVRRVFRGERGMLWGPYSMVPQPKDLKDLAANVRHFLYLGDRPKGDRWTYFEKFDYLAVFWGVGMIGLSGLFLWFPDFFTKFLPGWTLNAAYVIHSDEALLATGFIFVYHFFHTHLRPESFPMDTVVFTGKMTLERFKAERPLEYERIVQQGKLDDYLVSPPTAGQMRQAYFFGTLFLTIGVALAVGIIWALLTH